MIMWRESNLHNCQHFLSHIQPNDLGTEIWKESECVSHSVVPGSSVPGILQARILGWVANPFSRGSSWPKDLLSSVQFSHSLVSNSMPPHGLQHARLPCPSPTLGAYSNSCPTSRWCYPTISLSVVPFSSLQYFPTSGSFPISHFFASCGQNIGVSTSASVLPMNI